MRALILALNPSIDAEWRVDDVLWEEKNNVQSERRWAGGKGINVARWFQHLGGQPQLLLPLGGQTGLELARHLRAESISMDIVRLRESTRVNAIVTTNAGRQMRLNPLGPRLSRREWNAVLKRVERNLARMSKRREPHTARVSAAGPGDGAHGVTRPASLLILSGSLPRGVPVTAYARLVRLAHQFGANTLLDCDGSAFAAAVKSRPFLVKPNEHELAQWWRKPLRNEAAVLRAARQLSRQTRGWVLVSRGAKPGLLVNALEDFWLMAESPRVNPRNTVGAGDALLAAVARQIHLGQPPRDWLRAGLLAGAAATQCRAGVLPPRKGLLV